MTLSIAIGHNAECHHAECHVLFIVTLNVTMLSVVMLNVVLLSVIIFSVGLLSSKLRTHSLVSYNPKNLAIDKYPRFFDRTVSDEEKKVLTFLPGRPLFDVI